MQAAYGDLFQQLPSLLRGAAAGGAELVILLVRLEDLCIVHPESRYAPVTKKRISSNNAILGGTSPQSAAAHAAVESRIEGKSDTIAARSNFSDGGVDNGPTMTNNIGILSDDIRSRGEGSTVGESAAKAERRTQELDREREERECVVPPPLLMPLCRRVSCCSFACSCRMLSFFCHPCRLQCVSCLVMLHVVCIDQG